MSRPAALNTMQTLFSRQAKFLVGSRKLPKLHFSKLEPALHVIARMLMFMVADKVAPVVTIQTKIEQRADVHAKRAVADETLKAPFIRRG